MSKIICDVCGTAYPEASTQCPICGCVRPVNAQVVPSDTTENTTQRTYQHVKGGRFSKANVRKRTSGNYTPAYSKSEKTVAPSAPKKKKKKSNSNMGLLITIFALLLAIIAVVIYILVKFFIPASSDKLIVDTIVTEDISEFPVEVADDIYCEELTLDAYEIWLENEGDYSYITAMTDPFDTTEEVVFESADSAIAMVDSDGRITAGNKGETVITVSCGIVSAQCKVYVGNQQIVFELDRAEIIFNAPGESAPVYTGEIPLDNILWSCDDISVANVTGGVVTAVGSGTTMIYAEYDGEVRSCIVRCEFAEIPEETIETQPTDEEPTTEPSDVEEPSATEPAVTEAPSGNYTAPFQLKNLVGVRADDVSISVGESFKLALVDSNGKHVDGVAWSVNGSSCTVDNGAVNAVSSGYCEVIATYGGETYKCIVRVG